jgi:hypothetical protein
VPSGQTPVSPIPAAPATLEGVLIDILSGARALPLPL